MDRHGRGPGRGTAGASMVADRIRHGLHPIQLRLLRRAQGRRRQPPRPGEQPHSAEDRLRDGSLGPQPELAAALSRHGADRGHSARGLFGHHRSPDVALGLPSPAGPVAVADLRTRRHHERRPELRLRALPGAHLRQGETRAGPVALDRCDLSRRARAGADHRAVRRRLWPLRFPAGGVLPQLRLG